MKRSHARARGGGYVWFFCVRAALLACILTAVLVLLLAVSLKWEWTDMDSIDWINTAIKLISSAFAGYLTAKRADKPRWVPAGVSGALYMALSTVTFCILSGDFSLGFHTAADLMMTFACAGGVCIVIALLRERRAQQTA